MHTLITEIYNAQTGNYNPVRREFVNDEIAAQLIKTQVGKVPIHGFYRHRLETPGATFTWGSVCAYIAGFIDAKTGNKKQ